MLPLGKNKRRWIITTTIKPPTLHDNTGYVDRVLNTLKHILKTSNIRVQLSLARKIPKLVKNFNYQLTCVVLKNNADNWSLVHVADPRRSKTIAGLAIDLGTSCVSIRIIDLINGNKIGEKNFENPQMCIGTDILTRIHYGSTPEGLNYLHSMIINSINSHIVDLSREHNIASNDIYMLSVAGNTTMTHLFIKITPEHIFKEPYTPSINEPGIIRAKEIGILVNPNAQVFIFPNIGSYLGGDLIAGILYSGMSQRDTVSILADIGTNAEVVLGNRNWMVACAGAAGPALEGSVTKIGEIAKNGIVDKVKINSKLGHIEVSTIGNTLPRGICGSGIIDCVAQLFVSGFVDVQGKFYPSASPDFFIEERDSLHFIVVPSRKSASGKNLTISQTDISSLISSKAAMYSILETITGSVGIDLNSLDSFFIAGTFGLYINPKSAITIGMIPDIPNSLYKQIGNSSLGGATKILQNVDNIDKVSEIKSMVTYMELNVNQDFMNRFSAAKFLPHTDISKFPTFNQRKH